jgi:hypothetical protein
MFGTWSIRRKSFLNLIVVLFSPRVNPEVILSNRQRPLPSISFPVSHSSVIVAFGPM